MKEKHQCCETSLPQDSYDAWHPQQCKVNATILENNKWYCSFHAPSKITERRERKEAKWDAKWAKEKAGYERDALLHRITKDIPTEILIKHEQRIREWLSRLV
jgi:hypothetical protein